MKVLLIGKYPPCQGGIATAAWWRSVGLSRMHNVEYHVVTAYRKPYFVSEPSSGLNQVRGHQFPRVVAFEVASPITCGIPWTVLGTDFTIERLVSAALKLAEEVAFDCIETNYLAPFGVASWIVSTITQIPLLVSPASSDLTKLLMWAETHRICREVFKAAAVITAPIDRCQVLKTAGIDTSHWMPEQRYCPPVSEFNPRIKVQDEHPSLSLLGKIPFHWRNRGLEPLFQSAPEIPIRLALRMDGEYYQQVKSLADHMIPPCLWANQHFCHPVDIPCVLSETWGTWCVWRKSSIVDFPNLVWESIALGRPVLLDEGQREIARREGLPETGVIYLDSSSPESVQQALRQMIKMKEGDVLILLPDQDVKHFMWLKSHFEALCACAESRRQ